MEAANRSAGTGILVPDTRRIFEFSLDADFLEPAVEQILFQDRREPTVLVTLCETQLLLTTRTRKDECWCQAAVHLIGNTGTDGLPVSFKIDDVFLQRLSEQSGRLKFRYLERDRSLEWLHDDRSFKDNARGTHLTDTVVRFSVAPATDDTPNYDIPSTILDIGPFVEALTYLSVFGAKKQPDNSYWSGIRIDRQQAIGYSTDGIALIGIDVPTELTFSPSDLGNMIRCLRCMRGAVRLMLTDKEIIFESASARFCTIRHAVEPPLIPKMFSQTPACKITVDRRELVHKLTFLSAIDNRVSLGLVIEDGRRQLILQRATYNTISYGHLPGRYQTDQGLTGDEWVDDLYLIKDILGLICRPENRFVEFGFHGGALTITNDQQSGGGRALIPAQKK